MSSRSPIVAVLAVLAVLLASAVDAPVSPVPAAAQEVAAAYHAAAEAQDFDALVELWRAHPDQVLGTIDADLESSLAEREQAGAPDAETEATIAALHARALFGARAASEATGHPIFLDYATSFTSWDRERQERFRKGQGAFGAAMAAVKAGDAETAAAQGRLCLELAEPLGDWWGTAMGHTAIARAAALAGDAQGALLSHARARLIHHDLGLYGSEYGNLLGMIEACRALELSAREAEHLRSAVALGGTLGDEGGVARWSARLDELSAAAAAAAPAPAR